MTPDNPIRGNPRKNHTPGTILACQYPDIQADVDDPKPLTDYPKALLKVRGRSEPCHGASLGATSHGQPQTLYPNKKRLYWNYSVI
ncbi:hypothetical protein DPMN_143872 [Dreissena polymorpha]|uniref:Uncharacterized protein n=1 Tax=Dreissena polymorpha TaxID=45954 RepID=A0A9D4GDX6_DREPO|nr:hypothetical protein DPMN_143872 [Dreissena polymorpha]